MEAWSGSTWPNKAAHPQGEHDQENDVHLNIFLEAARLEVDDDEENCNGGEEVCHVGKALPVECFFQRSHLHPSTASALHDPAQREIYIYLDQLLILTLHPGSEYIREYSTPHVLYYTVWYAVNP